MKLNLRFSIKHCQILRRDEFEMADLSGYFESERPAYLYCILSKNRITINHESVNFTDSHIKTEFIIQNKNEFIKEQLDFKHSYTGLEEVKVVSDFPYSQFKIVDEAGSTLVAGKAAYFPELEEAYGQVKNKELLDYEILYIGQSVLSKNKIPVVGRITKHPTFQKILEDYNQFHPDKELFSFFFSFKQDALLDIPEEVTEEERANFIKGFQMNYLNPTSKEVKQNVTLMEAALINYFKPTYNDKFVEHSPSKNHDSYSGVSKLNLDKVNVLFGIENFLPKLYTNKVGRKSEHVIEHKIK